MALYQPAYRLTLYAPRSVDATETTILTPIGGAAHSDPFKVTTIPNLAGWQPYLDLPRGRQGSIDPLSKKLTQGALSMRVMDKRTVTGGSNANRWVTAFLGNAQGKQRLIGCKVLIEESLDGGVTWLTAFFTGRVFDVGLSPDRIGMEFQIRDLSDDLKKHVFVGRPHASITYAFQPSLAPVGLPQAWGHFAAVARLKGTIHRLSATKARLTIDSGQDFWSRVVLSGPWLPTQLWHVVLTSAGNTGIFLTDPVKALFATISSKDNKFGPFGYTSFEIDEQAVGSAGYLAMPADLAAVTFYVTVDTPPTKDFPLLVSDVHPVQHLADLIDGKFSKLKSDGSAIAIAPRAKVAGWTTGDPWKPLIDDTSFQTMRPAMDKLWKLNDYAEKAICQIYQLAYRLNGAGEVELLDLRRSSSVTAGLTITDTHLAELAPAWKVSRDSAMTGAELMFYVADPVPIESLKNASDMFPAYPAAGLQLSQVGPVYILNDVSTLGDLGERSLKMDALGLTFSRDEISVHSPLQASLVVARGLITKWTQDALTPFATGAATLPLVCRRGFTETDTCIPGSYRFVQVTVQPDPLLNVRGGTRLMLCTGRTENGLTLALDFIDTGVGSLANTPTISSAAVASDDIQALAIAVTLNADSDRVIVEYNVTATSVGSRPAANDKGWLPGSTFFASTTQRITALPQSARVWLRARSYPIGGPLHLPSAYVFLGAPGYVDMGAITAASAVSHAGLVGNRVDLSWTNADTTRRVEILLTTGGVPGAWTDAMRIASLDPGATTYRVRGLTISTAYAVGVRLRDDFGGLSSVATDTFTTTGTPGVAPLPAGLDLAVR